jgi:hypothetical protein
MRHWLPALLLVAVPLHGQFPHPPAGAYNCTQSYITTGGVSNTGGAFGTMVTTGPGGFGDLIIDRLGGYRMSGSRDPRATFRFDPRTGRMTFAGMLAVFGNTYHTRGRTLMLEFSNGSVSFNCALETTTDYGQQTGESTSPPGAVAKTPRRVAMAGTLYFATVDGIVRLSMTDGATSTLSRASDFDVLGADIVFVTQQQGVSLTNADGMGTRPLPVFGNSNAMVRWSPDGQRIALMGVEQPTSVEAMSMAMYTTASMQPMIVSRDGRVQMAFGTGYTHPSWAPDGRMVMAGTKAVGSLAGNAKAGIFLSAVRSSSVRRIDPNFDAPHSPAVSPDGSQVAFVNGSKLWVMPLTGGQPRGLYEGTSRFLGPLAWSPDGSMIAIVDNQYIKAVSLAGVVTPVNDRNGNAVQSVGSVVWR